MSFYGRFLVTSNATMAMPTMKTMIIATTAYMSVVFEAKPVSGVAVGAAVGAEALA
jgi:hypothetical protein